MTELCFPAQPSSIQPLIFKFKSLVLQNEDACIANPNRIAVEIELNKVYKIFSTQYELLEVFNIDEFHNSYLYAM